MNASAFFDLTQYGLHGESIARNLSPARLYEEAIRHDAGSAISDTGALIVSSGKKTGRSPLDKRIVRRATTENEVWWGTGQCRARRRHLLHRSRAR